MRYRSIVVLAALCAVSHEARAAQKVDTVTVPPGKCVSWDWMNRCAAMEVPKARVKPDTVRLPGRVDTVASPAVVETVTVKQPAKAVSTKTLALAVADTFGHAFAKQPLTRKEYATAICRNNRAVLNTSGPEIFKGFQTRFPGRFNSCEDLANYMANDLVDRPCTSIYGQNSVQMWRIKRGEADGNWARTCHPGEMIAFDTNLGEAMFSESCGNIMGAVHETAVLGESPFNPAAVTRPALPPQNLTTQPANNTTTVIVPSGHNPWPWVVGGALLSGAAAGYICSRQQNHGCKNHNNVTNTVIVGG